MRQTQIRDRLYNGNKITYYFFVCGPAPECYDQRHVSVDSHPKLFVNSPEVFWSQVDEARRATVFTTGSHFDSGDLQTTLKGFYRPHKGWKLATPTEQNWRSWRWGVKRLQETQASPVAFVVFDWESSQRSVCISIFSGPRTGRSSPFALPSFLLFCSEIPVNKYYKQNMWWCETHMEPCWQHDWAFRQNCWLLWQYVSNRDLFFFFLPPFFFFLKVVSVLRLNTRCESNYQSVNLEPGSIPACTCCTESRRNRKPPASYFVYVLYAKHIVNSWTTWQKTEARMLLNVIYYVHQGDGMSRQAV